MSLEFFSAPIFKFKVSMDSSHQAWLNGVVLLKIDGTVQDINEKIFCTKHVFF